MVKEKSKIAAGLLALFLGALGVHKFYLNYTLAGVITLAINVLGIIVFPPISLIVCILTAIEGLIYLTKSDEAFQNTYVYAKREWF